MSDTTPPGVLGDNSVTWSVFSAPAVIGGACRSWEETDHVDKEHESDGRVILSTGTAKRRTEWSFETTITDASTAYLDLNAGWKIDISKWTTGVAGVTSAEEYWEEMKTKYCSLKGLYFPAMADSGGASARTTTTAFTPTPSYPKAYPSAKCIWGLAGMAQAAGKIKTLRLKQELQGIEMETEPVNETIISAYASDFIMTLELTISSRAANGPAPDTILALTGGNSNMGGFMVESCKAALKRKVVKIYEVSAFWTPSMGTGT